MYKWKYPEFKYPSNLLDVTDEILSSMEKENKICEDYNKSVEQEYYTLKNKICIDVSSIWGKESNIVKYIEKQKIRRPSLTQYDSIKSNVLKAREAHKQKLQDVQSKNKLIELQGKAIEYLLKKGKIINVDFSIDTVITIANEFAFNEAVEIQQKELTESKSYIDFNGSDNCEDCPGWDGSSHRCACGNRRVSWDGNDSSDFFLNPYIYGQAY